MFGAFTFSGAVFGSVPAESAGETVYDTLLDEVDGDDVFLVELIPYQVNES